MSKKNPTKPLSLSRETLKHLRLRTALRAGLIGDKGPPQGPTEQDYCATEAEHGCLH